MPALILTFSPGEKEQLARVSSYAGDCPANPAHEFSGRRQMRFSFYLGEKAGREDVSVCATVQFPTSIARDDVAMLQYTTINLIDQRFTTHRLNLFS